MLKYRTTYSLVQPSTEPSALATSHTLRELRRQDGPCSLVFPMNLRGDSVGSVISYTYTMIRVARVQVG